MGTVARKCFAGVRWPWKATVGRADPKPIEPRGGHSTSSAPEFVTLKSTKYLMTSRVRPHDGPRTLNLVFTRIQLGPKEAVMRIDQDAICIRDSRPSRCSIPPRRRLPRSPSRTRAMRCASFTARCRARCWWGPRFTPHRERASGKAPALIRQALGPLKVNHPQVVFWRTSVRRGIFHL